jgi:hypothetical protein
VYHRLTSMWRSWILHNAMNVVQYAGNASFHLCSNRLITTYRVTPLSRSPYPTQLDTTVSS